MLGKPLNRGVHGVGALDEAAGGSGRARVRVRLSPESRSVIGERDLQPDRAVARSAAGKAAIGVPPSPPYVSKSTRQSSRHLVAEPAADPARHLQPAQ